MTQHEKNEDHLVFTGTVIDQGKGVFRIQVDIEGDGSHVVKAKLSGKMRMHKIMVVVGDRVKVKVSGYDLTNGIITHRL